MAAKRLLLLLLLVAYAHAEKAAPSLGETQQQYKALIYGVHPNFFRLIFAFNMICAAGIYNVDRDQISVSGLSSGAYFAVQFHVSFSKTIMGAGVVAGGNFSRGRNIYMSRPSYRGSVQCIVNIKACIINLIDQLKNLVLVWRGIGIFRLIYQNLQYRYLH